MPKRKGREREYDREWRAANPDRVLKNSRRWQAMTRYGMTLDEYEKFLARPCMICGDPAEVVDHGHDTGKVRGALCHHCNRGLGFFLDDEDRLLSAIQYLRDADVCAT